jgi:hypothetical protein
MNGNLKGGLQACVVAETCTVILGRATRLCCDRDMYGNLKGGLQACVVAEIYTVNLRVGYKAALLQGYVR